MQRTAKLVLSMTLIGIASAAGQPSTQNACFPINQMQGWKAPDNKTIFIRVNLNQYYRLDLSGSCPMLTMSDSHLITKVRGSNLICTAVDWDLSVAESPPGGMAVPCIVKQMTLLTSQQVAAIPPKFKP